MKKSSSMMNLAGFEPTDELTKLLEKRRSCMETDEVLGVLHSQVAGNSSTLPRSRAVGRQSIN